jgi:hypothetical protein
MTAEKRGLLLERLSARLQLLGYRFTAAEFDQALNLALTGLTTRAAWPRLLHPLGHFD